MSNKDNTIIDNMDRFEGSNLENLSIINTLQKQNEEYLMEIKELKNKINNLNEIDTQKLIDALVSVLEITPEIKEKGDTYHGTWETVNAHTIKDSIETLFEVLDKRYKQLD